jgi:hypothetical protein
MRALTLLALLVALPAAATNRRPAFGERAVWPDLPTTDVTIGDHGIPQNEGLPVLDPRLVEYLGAFRVPECWDHSAADPEPSSFEYASDHICFVPAEGGHPASLYLAGYFQQTDPIRGGKFGRIAIATPHILNNANDLDLATVIDSLHIYDGVAPNRYINNMTLVGPQPRVGDIFWLDTLAGQTEPHLYMSVWTKYQSPNPAYNVPTFFTNTEDRANRSHIWNIGPRQDHEDRSDPWFMWKHCDFIFRVPDKFCSEAAIFGRYLAIGNGNRDGGHALRSGAPACTTWWASCNSAPESLDRSCMGEFLDTGRIGIHLGPGFAMIDPLETVSDPADSTSITASEAAGYYESGGGNSHYVEHDWTAPFFCEGAYVCDIDFADIGEIFSRGHHAVVFVVQKATHQCDYSNPLHCYSGPNACGDGHDLPGYVSGHLDDGFPTSLPDVRAELWFFNPNDYIRVILGLADPWTPRAYAKIDLTNIFYQTRGDVCPPQGPNLHMGGVAYDVENSTLYVEEGTAWTARYDSIPKYPVIHVFKIHAPS